MASGHPAIPFEQWAKDVDELCRRHFCCSWKDLCGELEPLQQAYVSAEAPMQFVERWGEKYDLMWADANSLRATVRPR